MSMINNTNYLAITHNLYQVTQDMNQSSERLATGLRINSSKDDPAGLVMSERMKTYANSCDAGIQNAQLGSTLLNLVEDSLGEVSDQLDAIYEIVDNAKDASMTTAERTALQEEIDTRWDTIVSIFDDTTFNGSSLFNGSAKTVTLESGSVSLASSVFTDKEGSWTKGAIDTTGNATTFATNLTTYMDSVSAELAKVGGYQNNLSSAIELMQYKQGSYEYTGAVIRDADIAQETTNLTVQQVLQQASTSMLGNMNSYSSLYLSVVGSSSIY